MSRVKSIVWLAALSILTTSAVAEVGLPSRCLPSASSPYTCGSPTTGRCYTNTGDTFTYFCNGSSWVAGIVNASGAVVANQFTFGSAYQAANSISYNVTAGCITFEGSTAGGGAVTNLCVTDPSTTNNYSLPNTDGTVDTIVINGLLTSTAWAYSGASTHSGNETFSGQVITTGSQQGAFPTKAMTSGAAAVAFVTVTTVSGSAGNVVVEYSNEVANATDFQSFGGLVDFDYVNKAGVITCSTSVAGTTIEPAVAVSTASTLTHTFSCADGGSNVLQLKFTDTTNLTSPTSNLIRYRVRVIAPTTLTVTAQ